MAQITIVNMAEVIKESNSMRIDSEYFKQEYLSIERKIKRNKFKLLKEFKVEIIHPNEIKREYCNKGVLFLRAQNVRPNLIDLSNMVYICESDAKRLYKNRIKKENILITRTGANFGDTAIFLENIEAIASSHTFIVKSGEANPYFLSIFLNTKFGRKLIDRGMYGGSQPEIAPFYLQKIPIPVLSDSFIQQIENQVRAFQSDLCSAKKLYQQAEQLFLKEIGLGKLNFLPELAYSANFSETLQYNRIDAEFYQPKYGKMVELVKEKIKVEKLRDLLAEEMQKGIEVGSEEYLDEGVPFVRVSNLNKFEIDEDSQKFISRELFESLKDKFNPKKGEILLSKDATPGIAFIFEEDRDMIISGGILRLKAKGTIEKNYLALALNSIFVQMQIERDAGGSIIVHWRPELIEETLIPVLPKETREKISKLVEESFKVRKKAKVLLEEAKRKVEEAIEKAK